MAESSVDHVSAPSEETDLSMERKLSATGSGTQGSSYLVIDRGEELQRQLEEQKRNTTQQVNELRGEVEKLWGVIKCYTVISVPLLIGWILYIISKVSHSKLLQQYVMIINIAIISGILIYDFWSVYAVLQALATAVQERVNDLVVEYYGYVTENDSDEAVAAVATETEETQIEDIGGTPSSQNMHFGGFNTNPVDPLEVD